MNTVFIGGSRHISRLSNQVKERLHNITDSGAHVIVGDANGADKAVQRFLQEISYEKVTIFCSGDICRNNLGGWLTRNVKVPNDTKGFAFYAAKDREMAHQADFGLMVWDGKSAGTILNILRLLNAGKKAVLLNVPQGTTTTFKAPTDWNLFMSHFSADFRNELRKRVPEDEWIATEPAPQASLFDSPEQDSDVPRDTAPNTTTPDDVVAEINTVLANGDPASIVNTLGNLAKARGMSQVAKDTGLARESLYRSLGRGGNPEFTTVLKIISSMGLRFMVGKASDKVRNEQS